MAAPLGNKFALGNTGGKPPYYANAEELTKKITEYFDSCQPIVIGSETIQNPPTCTGLALYLGFAQRKSLIDYKEKEEYRTIIQRAITCVELAYEQRLSGNSPTGAIFALKNMGWVDRQEIDQTNKTITVEIKDEDEGAASATQQGN